MNVLIVEDEAHTAALLQEIIEQDKDFIVTHKLESIEECITYLRKYQHNIDLLFFDIQLADGLSFEIFKHIDVVKPIIFCTAFDAYPLQAFKNNGIDYVLKPFKEEDIHSALEKYKSLIQQMTPRQAFQFPTQVNKQYQQTFLTQYREKSLVKKAEEIALFSVESETVYLYTFSGERLPLFKKMEYIESVCDPQQFYRINRQMLVRRSAILSFEPYFNRKIVLQLKVKTTDQAIVSRLKVSAFKEWLEQ